MLTAWLIISVLMGIAGMFGELRKGNSLTVALCGFVCTVVLWPVAVVAWITVIVIMFVYTAGMKFF